ncbi:sulfotransferase family protein [Flavobacterium sp. YO64]|uniref:sulfotransferase family protein n=1 Tax=Flavobacterium sp. YO64 TaxID=394559 RepID=UPI00100BEAEE|nr:sulfotransferase family protein [Flavobacterium sp. YO64]RXM46764.1 sulfotransferase family protein [Flavobacterium sp. YO64]
MKNIDHPLSNWIPYKLIENDNELFFEWIYLSDEKIIAPFFQETISKCKAYEFNSKRVKVVSTLENLIEWSQELESVPLKTLVFHVSRCGSTMLSQCLATSSENIMISEGPIIDQILRCPNLDLDKKTNLLKAVLQFLGQKRSPEQKYLIVKLDAWHIFNASYFRSVFPETPFGLLYRNPVEVLKSHQKMMGMHMVPNLIPPAVFGISFEEMEGTSFSQYGALVLEKYFQGFLDFYETDQNVTLLNYNEGMKNALEKLISFINIDYSHDELEKMWSRLKQHSKNKDVAFEGDLFKEEELSIDFSKLDFLHEKLNNTLLEHLEH